MDEKEFVKSVGKEIANKRKQAGLTQGDVAVKLGVEKETVSRLETGAISPTLARLHQLSAIFACSVGHFFWHTEGNEQAQAETIA
ncbi:MAG: helix-turn-helix domain-containing protein, partial [Deltaproteobacteria bacterium]|nr:helix-turn-helix domain-containing protein [Deltaproteobacteria bacterium]